MKVALHLIHKVIYCNNNNKEWRKLILRLPRKIICRMGGALDFDRKTVRVSVFSIIYYWDIGIRKFLIMRTISWSSSTTYGIFCSCISFKLVPNQSQEYQKRIITKIRIKSIFLSLPSVQWIANLIHSSLLCIIKFFIVYANRFPDFSVNSDSFNLYS